VTSYLHRFDRFGRPAAASIAFAGRATDYSMLSVFPGRR
jgi:hypothetical protein